MNNHENQFLALISASLWGGNIDFAIEESIYQEFVSHAIVALPAEVLSKLDMPDQLREKWKNAVIQQISQYVRYTYEQRSISIDVPYIVLKGTSAAKYYPHPEYRAMGDIDIITRHGDYEKARQKLVASGYREIVSDEDEDGRHTAFKKNGVLIELHRYFAKMNDATRAEFLDDLILNHITENHILPDDINGLVILEHIGQHLEEGLGLRQIIDWMMFIYAYMTKDTWPEFRKKTDRIGLTNLAITLTQMCTVYMGLPKQIWCEDVDIDKLKVLVEYILQCGNFGNKHVTDEDNITYILTRHLTLTSFFSTLQKSGLKNWTVLENYPGLKPFAWIYQLCRYIGKGSRADWARSLKEVKKRTILFDQLGVRQEKKGLAVYQNGKFVKG